MSKSIAKKEIINGKYNRHFSEAFKREKIKEIEKGVLSIGVYVSCTVSAEPLFTNGYTYI